MAYINISDDYKNMIKSNAVIGTARIKVEGQDDYIGSDILQEITLKDYCYDEQNGTLIGNTPAKQVEITLVNNNKDLDLEDKEFSLELGLVLDVDSENREFVPIGNFIVDSYEDLKSNNQYKLVAYDYMVKMNTEYQVDENIYPCTLKEFYYNLCNQYGIRYVEQTLPNENFMVEVATAPNLENMTGRAVLSACAQLFGKFAMINRDNQMEMVLTNETDEVVDGYSMNSKLSMNKKYGPVNVVSLEMSKVKGENVTKQDKESIKANGETTISIIDNPFVWNEALREKAIDELFNALKGFEYMPVEFNYKGRAYLDKGDIITVEDVSTGETAKTIYLNGTICVPALRNSIISAKALTNTAVKQKYISKSKQENTRTEISVDKLNQKINLIVSQSNDTTQKVTQLDASVEQLSSKISETADVTKTADGYGGVEVADVNTSEPILLKVHSTGIPIRALYPSNDLLPNDLLYPHNREIEFRRKDNEGNVIDKIIYNLPADLYWYNENVYDEFTLDYENQKCYVTRRTSYNPETNEVTALGTEETEEYDYPTILLQDGDYIVIMPSFETAYIYVRLMSKNIYTSQFATKTELNSSANLTKESINLSVNQKLSNYSTTSQMNSSINMKSNSILNTVSQTYTTKTELTTSKSEIKQITDNISSEVSKKVGNNEIISKINQSAESVQINANKISLERKNNKPNCR